MDRWNQNNCNCAPSCACHPIIDDIMKFPAYKGLVITEEAAIQKLKEKNLVYGEPAVCASKESETDPNMYLMFAIGGATPEGIYLSSSKTAEEYQHILDILEGKLDKPKLPGNPGDVLTLAYIDQYNATAGRYPDISFGPHVWNHEGITYASDGLGNEYILENGQMLDTDIRNSKTIKIDGHYVWHSATGGTYYSNGSKQYKLSVNYKGQKEWIFVDWKRNTPYPRLGMNAFIWEGNTYYHDTTLRMPIVLDEDGNGWSFKEDWAFPAEIEVQELSGCDTWNDGKNLYWNRKYEHLTPNYVSLKLNANGVWENNLWNFEGVNATLPFNGDNVWVDNSGNVFYN